MSTFYRSDEDVTRILSQAVQATANQFSNDRDVEVAKARLAVINEVSLGLGVKMPAYSIRKLIKQATVDILRNIVS